MIVNLPDGITEVIATAYMGLQVWQVKEIFNLKRKIDVLLAIKEKK